jgi:hypothetical protein
MCSKIDVKRKQKVSEIFIDTHTDNIIRQSDDNLY